MSIDKILDNKSKACENYVEEKMLPSEIESRKEEIRSEILTVKIMNSMRNSIQGFPVRPCKCGGGVPEKRIYMLNADIERLGFSVDDVTSCAVTCKDLIDAGDIITVHRLECLRCGAGVGGMVGGKTLHQLIVDWNAMCDRREESNIA